MDELKNRKTTRLKGADYNRNQAVFLTICTQERKCILSHIVGTGVPDGPHIKRRHLLCKCLLLLHHLVYSLILHCKGLHKFLFVGGGVGIPQLFRKRREAQTNPFPLVL